jgi:hypothetical protein
MIIRGRHARRTARERLEDIDGSGPPEAGEKAEHAQLTARSYQWLTSSKRRRLALLDARAVVARYPWLARTEAARHASKEPEGRSL